MLDANDGLRLETKRFKKEINIAKKKNLEKLALIQATQAPAAKRFCCFYADSQLFGEKKLFWERIQFVLLLLDIIKSHFCLDMATTQISWNKLLNFKRLKK